MMDIIRLSTKSSPPCIETMAARKNWYLFVLFIIFLFLFISQPTLVLTTDTISANQSLSGDQKLTSENGKFVFGFFRPDNTSSNWYIGIWYGKISVQTVVWVANRENPVTDPSKSEFMIFRDGNLILLNQFRTLVWSTNSKNTTFNSNIAVILDTGNFVLRDKFNPSKIMWQSFGHPTNTWLPGAPLGIDKITGVNQYLISWKEENNPAPGLFSLGLEPNERDQYIVQWNESVVYWNSGKWNGKIFVFSPKMVSKNYNNLSSEYSFVHVNDTISNYYNYLIKDDSLIMHVVIDVLGRLNAVIWKEEDKQWFLYWAQPPTHCQVYALCGSFGICNENFQSSCQCVIGFTEKNSIAWGLEDYSGGCVRKTSLQCESNMPRKGDEDKFHQMNNMILPSNSRSMEINNIEDCEIACLNNCSCTAYSYNNGCFLWYGDLINLHVNDEDGGQTLFLRLASSELSNPKTNKGLVVGVILGACFVLVFLSAVTYFVLKNRRRTRKLKRVNGGGLTTFRYSDLQYITKDFSNMIGKGGFGSVFKGLLPDSTVVAVKRLERINQGDKPFRAEVSTLGTIQHLNLIRLFGFCSENKKKLLIYEYMSMGSLDRHLFGNTSKILTWKIRYHIALGISRGLLYLHEKCRECIIHCDIKPENILLDDAFVPKIADFGLAKLLGHDFSRVLTTTRGTIGYLAPEWIVGTAITAKVDVYSYGMVLLEIISGKRNSNLNLGEERRDPYFPILAAKKLQEGDVLSLLDPNLNNDDNDANKEEIIRVCKVGIWCIQDEEDSRPSMIQIVKILEGNLDVNMPPIPNSYRVYAEKLGSLNFFSSMSSN